MNKVDQGHTSQNGDSGPKSTLSDMGWFFKKKKILKSGYFWVLQMAPNFSFDLFSIWD